MISETNRRERQDFVSKHNMAAVKLILSFGGRQANGGKFFRIELFRRHFAHPKSWIT
jgi:hypothetical protein